MEAEKTTDIPDYLGLVPDGDTSPDLDGSLDNDALQHKKSKVKHSYRDAVMRCQNEARKRVKSEQRAEQLSKHKRDHLVSNSTHDETKSIDHKQGLSHQAHSNGDSHQHPNLEIVETLTNGAEKVEVGIHEGADSTHEAPEEQTTYPTFHEAALEVVEGLLAMTSSTNWTAEFRYLARRGKEVLLRHWSEGGHMKHRAVSIVQCTADVIYFSVRAMYLLFLMSTHACLIAIQLIFRIGR